MLLFGMGITLTDEEDNQLESVRKPCYAALGLANDYFSFDREYAEFQASGESQTLVNSVWLHMKWHNVDVAAAKEMVRQATQRYEAQFLDLCGEYRHKNSPLADHVDRYLRALAYQVSGNVVWSLNCPRYHPRYRYDPNAGLEDALTADRFSGGLGETHVPIEVHSARNSRGNEVEPISLQRHQRRESTETTTTTESDDNSSVDSDISTASSRSSCGTVYDHDHHQRKQASEPAQLDDRHVRAPFEYITSLPSKGVRDTFVDALNVWLAIPEPTVSRIKSLGSRLHSASLMLDDIEDGSDLRRSQPATHKVFGVAQTINSGCYEILKAVGEATQLGIPSAVDITLKALDELHIGQSYDLYWTRHYICPSEEEYLEMVDKKTGGLFRLLARLMLAATPTSCDRQLADSIETLVSLVGSQFQIRDDYQNLQSTEYADQKGFCEDLDEGKFSFPLIHALSCNGREGRLRELLRQRQASEGLSNANKVLILIELEEAGSLRYTKGVLQRIQEQVSGRLERLECDTGSENWILRALLQKLEI
jgi:geranylgeranyl pyrophosphate synthase